MPVDLSLVVSEWMAAEQIVSRAAVYKVMSVEIGISPDAAAAHHIILGPLMKHLGPVPSLTTFLCCNRLQFFGHLPLEI